MAGDWIKMRVWLSRDPRVITMADFLAGDRSFMSWLTDPVQRTCKDNAYEHVTRNVTVALCVSSLLIVWGTAREQGDRENDDLVLTHTRLCTLDAMCDIPSFGDAMAFVGWAIEREDGAVVFPKFFRENESPDERHKRQNAERQARYRDKQSRESNAEDNVIRNVTVTTEKRREEKSNNNSSTPVGFDSFWKVWPTTPRKQGKSKCQAVWLRKNLEARSAEILSHVEAMKATDSWRGGYEPMPMTYLNQERWDGAETETQTGTDL